LKSVLAAASLKALLALSALTTEAWQTAYDGEGKVSFEAKQIRLKPAAALSPEQTHSALVLSRDVQNIKYFELDVTYINLAALRQAQPNPWEVFWVLFNYRKSAIGKETNYLVLKTNGLEFGRATEEKKQTILKTYSVPRSAYGEVENLKIRRMGTRISIELGSGEKVIYDFSKDSEQPFAVAGAIGLYTEDAEVLITQFRIKEI
jgi:hypothetical protein